MTDCQTVIIGAGPAGLTAGYELARQGAAVAILERDDVVGGIARTKFYKGFGYDIGGHRFYTKMPEVNALWHSMLGEQFIAVPRLSRIHYEGKFFYYPLRLPNVIRTLGIYQSLWIFASYVRIKLFPLLPEESFEDYVSNRFGRKLYHLFFKTYTEKVWGIPCSEIRAEWAAQRIRGLSFTSVVKSSLLGNGRSQLKSLIESFEYPVLGPGMMWEAFCAKIQALGGRVLTNSPVVRIHREGTHVTAVVVRDRNAERELRGDRFISTMALRDLVNALEPPPPADVVRAANALHYRDFLTVILILDVPALFPDNWIYVHTPRVHVGRIQNFKNWSAQMVPDPTKTSLGMEYFVNEGDALWRKSDAELIALAKTELELIGLARAERVIDGTVQRMKMAYPVYDSTYRANVGIVRGYLDAFDNLQTIGRNGMHKYNNQDHSMMTGLLAARNILGAEHDVWAVNTDLEYQEEITLPAPQPRTRDRVRKFMRQLRGAPGTRWQGTRFEND